MTFKIMDVNRDGETVAVIHSTNGKYALKQFRNKYCLSSGIYEIRKGRYNWVMTSSYGAAFYAMPLREEAANND